MPADLEPETVVVWNRLAPFAVELRTLVPATVDAFALLCRQMVHERRLEAKEPGSAAHRGLMQRVEAGLLKFSLSPCGKPLYRPAVEDEKPANPLERFLNRRTG